MESPLSRLSGITMSSKKKTSKIQALRKLREAKAVKGIKAKPKPVRLKSFAQLPAPTPRADKVRSDTIALNLLIWDTAELESAKVASIASSYRETGTQISRITIRPAGKKFRVVAGRHRCEAAKAVGWSELKYELLPYLTSADKLNADLIEIDENLCRKNLTPAMEAALTARRKAIYEKMHPTKTHGGDRKSSRQVGDLIPPNPGEEGDGGDTTRFTEATAEAAGRSERSVQRAASRGEAIGADNLSRIAHTSLDKGEELDALAKLEPAERKDVMDRAAAGEKVSAKAELKKQTRAQKEEKLGGLQLALPDKKYGVILADPEWRFEPWSRETGMSRAADNHYPTSCTEVIAERDVPSIAADDCVLFLCATAPMLPHALLVMAAWGFDYKSNYVLEKDRIITGYWNRNKHEHLLIGVRGNVPCPAAGTQWDSIIPAPVNEHSGKPVGMLEMIEQYFPTLPKIELNRRGPTRAGWDAWGNELVPAESATPAETDRTTFDADYTERDALYAISDGKAVDPAIVALLRTAKLIRGSVKLNLTKAGIKKLDDVRQSASQVAEVEQSSTTAGPEVADRGGGEPNEGNNILAPGDEDSSRDFYAEAVLIVMKEQKASTSLVQRRLKIGYNFALSLMERMEKEGLIGPSNRAGVRPILRTDPASAATAPVDCRVCGDGNGLCAECLPAESHVVSVTSNPDTGWQVGTCSCGSDYTFPRNEHRNMDAAIKLHWQCVVAAAKKAAAEPATESLAEAVA